MLGSNPNPHRHVTSGLSNDRDRHPESTMKGADMKIIRFKITTVIPMDGRTQDEIEDDMIEALESIGARFTAWKVEIEDEEE
jgi:hypothetical protein